MKKVLSSILVVIMIVTAMPMTSFASNWLCEFTGEHTFSWKVTKAATCQATGVETEVCTRSDCGATRNEREIDIAGHTVTTKFGYPATCTKPGLTNGTWCEICNTIFDVQSETEPLGHNYDWTISELSTCTTVGQQMEICIVCGYKSGKVHSIPLAEHENGELDYIDSTCTEDGKITIGCVNCGEFEEEIIIPAKGHNYQSQWQTILNPKCTETGVAIKICKDCLEIQKTDIPSLGHTDVDFDGKCDRCGTANGLPQPEDPADSCSCNCHKTGMANFIFKFMLFFQKIFKTNKVCSCGAEHY